MSSGSRLIQSTPVCWFIEIKPNRIYHHHQSIIWYKTKQRTKTVFFLCQAKTSSSKISNAIQESVSTTKNHFNQTQNHQFLIPTSFIKLAPQKPPFSKTPQIANPRATMHDNISPSPTLPFLRICFGPSSQPIRHEPHSVFELNRIGWLKNSDFGVRVFNTIRNPNIFSWNTMIRFFAGFDPAIASRYYMKMLGQEIFPDKYTFTFLLQASFDLCSVQQVHCHILKLVPSDNLHVNNSLLTAYLVTCDSETNARLLFDKMPHRDIVSWTRLIFISQSNHRKALHVFRDLLTTTNDDDRQTRPNIITIITTMSVCSGLGSADLTKCLHSLLEKSGWLELDVSVVNSLIDAYAKSGDLNSLRKVFDTIQTSKRDLYSWTAIISGYAMHGRGHDALNTFSQMEEKHGLIPDPVTFVSILSACAHSGLVEQGLRVFHSMIAKYRIEPDLKHYGCIVDLLGRAGMVERAYNIVENMPMAPNLAVLGSLLNGCRLHNNLEFGKCVLRKIEKLKERGGADVLLSNIYANENEWGEVINIRKEMRERVKGKPPGRSWIQIKDEVHEFKARNETDPKAVELHVVLEGLEKLSRL